MDHAKFQRRVANVTRQYFRALAANDVEAVALESVALCSSISWLLEHHLKIEPKWDSAGKWLDGMINSKVTDLAERTLQVEGQMVLGLRENPGGEQWSEPFWAQIRATDSGLDLYEIRFGLGDEDDAPEVGFGFYPTLSATGDQLDPSERPAFRFIFHGGADHRESEAKALDDDA